MSEYGPGATPERGIFGEFELKDYLDIARRRKTLIILAAAAVAVMIAVIAMRLPDFYRSETVIMVDPQQVPNTVVASPVTASVLDRLSTIQQQVMSPSRLTKVIDSQGLYTDLRGKVSDQELVRKMQKATTIEVVNSNGKAMGTFRIAFQDHNPKVAANVANELADQFIDENLRARAGQFEGTSDFLNSELQDTKRQLEEKETEMGRITKVWMDQPRYHTTEDGRWDFRVTIVFKNAAVANEPFDEAALQKQMYPDQDTFQREEQRRFEILDAHWDLPVKPMDLDAKP